MNFVRYIAKITGKEISRLGMYMSTNIYRITHRIYLIQYTPPFLPHFEPRQLTLDWKKVKSFWGYFSSDFMIEIVI
jgi:hypothetical protein